MKNEKTEKENKNKMYELDKRIQNNEVFNDTQMKLAELKYSDNKEFRQKQEILKEPNGNESEKLNQEKQLIPEENTEIYLDIQLQVDAEFQQVSNKIEQTNYIKQNQLSEEQNTDIEKQQEPSGNKNEKLDTEKSQELEENIKVKLDIQFQQDDKLVDELNVKRSLNFKSNSEIKFNKEIKINSNSKINNCELLTSDDTHFKTDSVKENTKCVEAKIQQEIEESNKKKINNITSQDCEKDDHLTFNENVQDQYDNELHSTTDIQEDLMFRLVEVQYLENCFSNEYQNKELEQTIIDRISKIWSSVTQTNFLENVSLLLYQDASPVYKRIKELCSLYFSDICPVGQQLNDQIPKFELNKDTQDKFIEEILNKFITQSHINENRITNQKSNKLQNEPQVDNAIHNHNNEDTVQMLKENVQLKFYDEKKNIKRENEEEESNKNKLKVVETCTRLVHQNIAEIEEEIPIRYNKKISEEIIKNVQQYFNTNEETIDENNKETFDKIVKKVNECFDIVIQYTRDGQLKIYGTTQNITPKEKIDSSDPKNEVQLCLELFSIQPDKILGKKVGSNFTIFKDKFKREIQKIFKKVQILDVETDGNFDNSYEDEDLIVSPVESELCADVSKKKIKQKYVNIEKLDEQNIQHESEIFIQKSEYKDKFEEENEVIEVVDDFESELYENVFDKEIKQTYQENIEGLDEQNMQYGFERFIQESEDVDKFEEENEVIEVVDEFETVEYENIFNKEIQQVCHENIEDFNEQNTQHEFERDIQESEDVDKFEEENEVIDVVNDFITEPTYFVDEFISTDKENLFLKKSINIENNLNEEINPELCNKEQVELYNTIEEFQQKIENFIVDLDKYNFLNFEEIPFKIITQQKNPVNESENYIQNIFYKHEKNNQSKINIATDQKYQEHHLPINENVKVQCYGEIQYDIDTLNKLMCQLEEIKIQKNVPKKVIEELDQLSRKLQTIFLEILKQKNNKKKLKLNQKCKPVLSNAYNNQQQTFYQIKDEFHEIKQEYKEYVRQKVFEELQQEIDLQFENPLKEQNQKLNLKFDDDVKELDDLEVDLNNVESIFNTSFDKFEENTKALNILEKLRLIHKQKLSEFNDTKEWPIHNLYPSSLLDCLFENPDEDKPNVLVITLYSIDIGYSIKITMPSNELPVETFFNYDNDTILKHVENEQLPPDILGLLEKAEPSLFYCGCVIAEIHDQQNELNGQLYRILLRPSNLSILSDVNRILSDNSHMNWSYMKRLKIESLILLSSYPKICVDSLDNPELTALLQQNILEAHKFDVTTLNPFKNSKQFLDGRMKDTMKSSSSKGDTSIDNSVHKILWKFDYRTQSIKYMRLYVLFLKETQEYSILLCQTQSKKKSTIIRFKINLKEYKIKLYINVILDILKKKYSSSMLVVRKFKNDNETRPRFISVPILFRDIIYEPRHSDIIQVINKLMEISRFESTTIDNFDDKIQLSDTSIKLFNDTQKINEEKRILTMNRTKKTMPSILKTSGDDFETFMKDLCKIDPTPMSACVDINTPSLANNYCSTISENRIYPNVDESPLINQFDLDYIAYSTMDQTDYTFNEFSINAISEEIDSILKTLTSPTKEILVPCASMDTSLMETSSSTQAVMPVSDPLESPTTNTIPSNTQFTPSLSSKSVENISTIQHSHENSIINNNDKSQVASIENTENYRPDQLNETDMQSTSERSLQELIDSFLNYDS